MKIKTIHFFTGTKNESTTCDCCGKSIQNIYFIKLADDSEIRLGTTCFDKQMKTKLDKMAKKKVNHAIEFMKFWEGIKNNWETKTEEELKELYHGSFERIGQYEGIDTFDDLKKAEIEIAEYRIGLYEEDIAKYARL